MQRRTYLIHKERSRKRYPRLQYLRKLQVYSHYLPHEGVLGTDLKMISEKKADIGDEVQNTGDHIVGVA